jgi:hypothetical protein
MNTILSFLGIREYCRMRRASHHKLARTIILRFPGGLSPLATWLALSAVVRSQTRLVEPTTWPVPARTNTSPVTDAGQRMAAALHPEAADSNEFIQLLETNYYQLTVNELRLRGGAACYLKGFKLHEAFINCFTFTRFGAAVSPAVCNCGAVGPGSIV